MVCMMNCTFDTSSACCIKHVFQKCYLLLCRVNMGFDIAVEELHLSGSIQIVFYLSMDVSFPHISKASMSFIERYGCFLCLILLLRFCIVINFLHMT